jgi:hypothetical protein
MAEQEGKKEEEKALFASGRFRSILEVSTNPKQTKPRGEDG